MISSNNKILQVKISKTRDSYIERYKNIFNVSKSQFGQFAIDMLISNNQNLNFDELKNQAMTIKNLYKGGKNE